jgi:hypothetical protein
MFYFRDKMPSGIWFDGGSDWVVLHHDFALYALYSTDALTTQLKRFYAHTILPMESFFQTVWIFGIF